MKGIVKEERPYLTMYKKSYVTLKDASKYFKIAHNILIRGVVSLCKVHHSFIYGWYLGGVVAIEVFVSSINLVDVM